MLFGVGRRVVLGGRVVHALKQWRIHGGDDRQRQSMIEVDGSHRPSCSGSTLCAASPSTVTWAPII